MKIDLTQQEAEQLFAFLNRCSIQGNEAPAFLRLVQKMQTQLSSQQMGALVQKPQNLNKPEKGKR